MKSIINKVLVIVLAAVTCQQADAMCRNGMCSRPAVRTAPVAPAAPATVNSAAAGSSNQQVAQAQAEIARFQSAKDPMAYSKAHKQQLAQAHKVLKAAGLAK